MNTSIYLLHAKRRIKKNGKYPVKLRIVHLRVPKDFPIGIDLTEEEYVNATADRPRKQFVTTAIKINAAKAKAESILNAIGLFTFKKFEDAFYGRIKDGSDLFKLFDDYIGELKKEERIKTAISYQCARNSLFKFKNKLSLFDISASFLKAFHVCCVEKGLSETTIGIYVRSLRSIYNYAIAQGIIKKDETYPFGKRQYVIPAGRNIKKALSFDEVKAIHDYPASLGSPEDKARDFWMLSYLCNGINVKDIALLKNSNLDGDMLRFVRAKTKNSTRGNQTVISCHLSLTAKKLIGKWRSKDISPDAYIFSIIEKGDSAEEQVKKIAQFIQTTNKYMKRISESLGFERSATTYFSRHSAATILKRSGASIHQIQEALGHQSASTTQKYLDSFDDESKKSLSVSLSNFL